MQSVVNQESLPQSVLDLEKCTVLLTLDAHCCHMGTAIKHPIPDQIKTSFVIFDIRALWLTLSPERQLWCSGLSVRQSARMSKITNDGLTQSGTECFIAVPTCQQWASKG